MFNPDKDLDLIPTQESWHYSVENEGNKDAVLEGDVVEIKYHQKKEWGNNGNGKPIFDDAGKPVIEFVVHVMRSEVDETLWWVTYGPNNCYLALQKALRAYDIKLGKPNDLAGMRIRITTPPKKEWKTKARPWAVEVLGKGKAEFRGIKIDESLGGAVAEQDRKADVAGSPKTDLDNVIKEALEQGITDPVIKGFFMALAGGKTKIAELTNQEAINIKTAIEKAMSEKEGK